MTHDLVDKSPRYDQHGKLTFVSSGRGWVTCRRPFHAPFTMRQIEWDALAGMDTRPGMNATEPPYVYIPLDLREPPKPESVVDRLLETQIADFYWRDMQISVASCHGTV